VLVNAGKALEQAEGAYLPHDALDRYGKIDGPILVFPARPVAAPGLRFGLFPQIGKPAGDYCDQPLRRHLNFKIDAFVAFVGA